MGLRTGLDTVANRNKSLPLVGIKPQSFRLVTIVA